MTLFIDNFLITTTSLNRLRELNTDIIDALCVYLRGFWHFTLNLKKKNWQYAPVCRLYRGGPLFRYSITLKSSSIKYSIRIKSSYTRSNFKKKNLHGTRLSGNRVPCKKKFISMIAPYSGSPIVAFLSPIVTF